MSNHLRAKQILVILASFTLLFYHQSRAADADIKEVYFGYTGDAKPVSYQGDWEDPNDSDIVGYCGDLSEHLKNIGYNLSYRKQIFEDRFRGFMATEDQYTPALGLHQGGVECGPHSITSSRRNKLMALTSKGYKQADFSKSFYTTSTKLVVNNKSLDLFYENPRSLRIGVQGSTTNGKVIGSIFQDQDVISKMNQEGRPLTFVLVSSRRDAMNKLISEDINAYAGDELILREMLKELRKKVADDNLRLEFSIEPKLYGFTREDYGIVVYNSKVLLDEINKWISSPDGQESRRKWLEHRGGIMMILEYLLRQRYITMFIYLFILGVFLLVISHQLFLLAMLRILPSRITNGMYAILKAVYLKNNQSKSNILSPLCNVFLDNYLMAFRAHNARYKTPTNHPKRQEIIMLIQTIGIQPLSAEYHKIGLDDGEATRRAAETIESIETNNPWFSNFVKRYCGTTLEQIIEEVNISAFKNPSK
jgi:ABC-type amino acid transport substrate-binding protein